jgi:predicted permease
MLLTGARILSKDLDWLRHNAPGYDASGLYRVTARMGQDAREDAARRRQLASILVENIARTPGVVGASMGSMSFVRPNVRLEDQTAPTPAESRPLLMGVGPTFFEVVGTRIVSGRPFSSFDRNGAVPVAIVNEAAVAALWAGRNAVGSRLTLTDSGSAEPVTVVGVAADSKLSDPRLDVAAPAIIYRPYDQSPEQQLVVFARTGATVSSIRWGLHAALKEVTSGPIDQNDIVAMDDVVERELVQKRFNQLALAAFAVFGLILASVGVYGVVAYSVVQRTQEIGVRVALGARRADVVRLVMGESAALAALGMLLGLVAAFALAQVLRSTLAGTSPSDPMVFGASALLLAGVTAIASCIPVWRAARVDPAHALRGDNL